MFDIDKLNKAIVDVHDFPKKGIVFKDITPVFLQPELVKMIIDEMTNQLQYLDFDVIVSPESRGYIFGIPLSLKLNKPFVFVRKPGKLPRSIISETYELEYGTATLEITKQDIKLNQKVLIVDDILATGGTIQAITKLVNRLDAQVVGCLFLIELEFLKAKEKLSPIKVISLIKN